MDNELLHIAKLVAWPQMGKAYGAFQQEIIQGMTSAEKTAVTTSLWHCPQGAGADATCDALTEETFARNRRAKKPIPIPLLCEHLEQIRQAALRLERAGETEKHEAESTFRNWLERSVITRAAFEETNPGKEEPTRAAAEILARIRATPPCLLEEANPICLPLQNFKISLAPKIPTSFDIFDDNELEGGVEEGTTTILSGETNIGKSHLGLFSLSCLALRKHAVMICTGEDSEEATKRRIVSHFMRRQTQEIRAMPENRRREIMRELYGHEDDPESILHHIQNHVAISYFKAGTFTPEAVARRIKRFEESCGKPIKAVMCDYLQKMAENPKGKIRNRERDVELEWIVNELGEVFAATRCFGLVISQVPSHAAGGGFEFLNVRQAVARSYAATWGANYIITVNKTAEESRRLAASNDKRPRLNLFLCKAKDNPTGVGYTLGFPAQARWEFFRTKAQMEARIEAQAIAQEEQDINPEDWRVTSP
jgi:hypothetical protein